MVFNIVSQFNRPPHDRSGFVGDELPQDKKGGDDAVFLQFIQNQGGVVGGAVVKGKGD
jgi:hypothetical protein